MYYYYGFDSPLGPLMIVEEGGALVALNWEKSSAHMDTSLLRQAREQLSSYFCGDQCVFSLPLAPVETVFQRRVWSALCGIIFGTSCSYGVLARAFRDGTARNWYGLRL